MATCALQLDVITRQGSVVDAPDRLAGRGRPLAADFDGALLAVGFEDGGLATFGYRGWLRFHGGAVGAVKVLPGRMQVRRRAGLLLLSCNWSAGTCAGGLLHSAHM